MQNKNKPIPAYMAVSRDPVGGPISPLPVDPGPRFNGYLARWVKVALATGVIMVVWYAF